MMNELNVDPHYFNPHNVTAQIQEDFDDCDLFVDAIYNSEDQPSSLWYTGINVGNCDISSKLDTGSEANANHRLQQVVRCDVTTVKMPSSNLKHTTRRRDNDKG